mmetsp:Transcript_33594/g.103713  ORF Transcript_33594/g.103713 Transcript_33594/m.103713 type:complete len:254 (-) Transcript_33594:2038-2799(-)
MLVGRHLSRARVSANPSIVRIISTSSRTMGSCTGGVPARFDGSIRRVRLRASDAVTGLPCPAGGCGPPLPFRWPIVPRRAMLAVRSSGGSDGAFGVPWGLFAVGSSAPARFEFESDAIDDARRSPTKLPAERPFSRPPDRRDVSKLIDSSMRPVSPIASPAPAAMCSVATTANAMDLARFTRAVRVPASSPPPPKAFGDLTFCCCCSSYRRCASRCFASRASSTSARPPGTQWASNTCRASSSDSIWLFIRVT